VSSTRRTTDNRLASAVSLFFAGKALNNRRSMDVTSLFQLTKRVVPRKRDGYLFATLLLLMGVPACSPAAGQPPVAVTVAAPTPSPAPPVTVAAPTPSPGLASVPSAVAPTLRPSPTAARTTITVWVGETDGGGVYLRNSPHEGDRAEVLPDGTPLLVTGDEEEGDGQRWYPVKTADGASGYVQVIYTTRVEPGGSPAAPQGPPK
jgi:hypothetical protein